MNPPAMQEMRVPSLVWEDPLEKEMQPTPVFLLGNPMDRGAWQVSPWSCKRIGHDSFSD